MAKREFIEKEKVKKSLDEGWYRGVYPRNDIMCLHTFTEEDIVKPYLEKIQNKIIRQKQGGVTLVDCLWEIEDYVNSLLSEQGDTDNRNDN